MRSGGKENSNAYQVISRILVGTAKDSKSGKDATTLTVLQVDLSQLVVQGKGCTQDYANLRVLNEHPEIQSFSGFNSICNHSALFGIQGTSESGFAIHALAIAASELIAVATPGQVDAVQLDRAKQSTKSAILMNLELRMVAAEDIGKPVLTWRDSRQPVGHFLKAIEEITEEDYCQNCTKALVVSPHHDSTKCLCNS
ncbi:hypothetical protein OROMI_019307 [Orobanche minor]